MTELGNVLREARQAKGLSIEDIQDLTKIQKRYLEAIEEGNYEILPGQFYVRAFIRQYAETVGVDPSSYLVDKSAAAVESEDINEKHEEVKHEEIPSRTSKLKEPLGVNVKSSRVMDYLPKILIAVLVIGICIVIYMMFPSNHSSSPNASNSNQSNTEVEKPKNNALDKPKTEEPKDTTQTEPDVTNETPAQKITVDSAEGKRTSVSLSGNEAFKLEVVATTGDSYIDVKNASGKMFYSGIVKKGDSQSFDLTQEDEITVNIGASQNVELRMNDEVFQLPVSPSKAVHQYITIKNLKMNQ